MKPVINKYTNDILRAPEDSNAVIDLPITRTKLYDDTPVVISCWELSEEELEEVNKNRKIYFLCQGKTHPPVLLSTSSFIKEEEEHESNNCKD